MSRSPTRVKEWGNETVRIKRANPRSEHSAQPPCSAAGSLVAFLICPDFWQRVAFICLLSCYYSTVVLVSYSKPIGSLDQYWYSSSLEPGRSGIQPGRVARVLRYSIAPIIVPIYTCLRVYWSRGHEPWGEEVSIPQKYRFGCWDGFFINAISGCKIGKVQVTCESKEIAVAEREEGIHILDKGGSSP